MKGGRTMDIQHIDKQRFIADQQSEAQYFKKGSILRGRILKLFPQNKAHIQLGAHTFIAQLEASLQLGGSYHFQVQSARSEEHTSELQSRGHLVCRLLLEKKNR